MISVDEAVDILCATYGDLVLAARGLEVDQDDLALALDEVEKDTAREIALNLLKR